MRGSIALLLAALVATGCSQSAEIVDPTETPATEATTAAPSPEPAPTRSPRVYASPSASPTVTEDPTESESPTPRPTSTPTPTASPTPTPTESPARAVTPVATEPTVVEADGSSFAADGEQERAAGEDGACPVVPAEGESIDACVRGRSGTHERDTVVVASSTAAGRAVTIYDRTPEGWRSTFVAEDPAHELRSLRRLPWVGTDDVFVAEFPFAYEIITTDAAEGSRIAATLPNGRANVSTYFAARRVIVRDRSSDTEHLQVLAPPAGSGGLSGTTITAEKADQRLPEEVGLRVYRAWVSGDRALVADYVTPEVDRALFEETPVAGDLFEMVGTTCPVEGDAYVCRFSNGDQTTTWDLRPVDGVLVVAGLR